jgi:hypothetical protein
MIDGLRREEIIVTLCKFAADRGEEARQLSGRVNRLHLSAPERLCAEHLHLHTVRPRQSLSINLCDLCVLCGGFVARCKKASGQGGAPLVYLPHRDGCIVMAAS